MKKKAQKKVPIIGAIAGAKGGVGKSMVTSNLGIQLAEGGLKVVILDLDLGASNQHTLFGISSSTSSWVNYLKSDSKPLSYYLAKTKQPNLSLLPAIGYIPEASLISQEQKRKLVENLKQLDCDVVLMDLGAGSHLDTLDFFTIADLKIIVSSPEHTALMNNFEFIKNVVFRAMRKLFKNHEIILELLKEYQFDSEMTIESLISKIEEKDEWHALNLREMLSELKLFVIFNQIKTIEEAKYALKLKKICQSKLSITPSLPGFVFYSEEIRASIQKMQPISFLLPQCTPSQIFKRITHALIMEMKKETKEEKALTIAWDQLQKDFYKNRVDDKKAKLTL